MKIADVPPVAVQSLKASLDRYLSGLGRPRLLQQNIDPGSLETRGALAEARLRPENLDAFLAAHGTGLDAFFTRLRVFVFSGDRPIGSVGLLRVDPQDYQVEHISLGGMAEIVQGLVAAEGLPESAASEARLLRMPSIYLSALVLVRNGSLDNFFVITPPYPDGVAARKRAPFRQFVGRLLLEHRAVFPV